MKIKFILDRRTNEDHLYGTGTWLKGETKEVPEELAVKLLRHPDVYETSKAKATETVVVPDKKEREGEEKLQEIYDMISRAEIPALKEFIKTQFNQDVKADAYKNVAELRTLATRMADQYGILQ